MREDETDEALDEVEDYDYFNEGYPGIPGEYPEFDGWRDEVI